MSVYVPPYSCTLRWEHKIFSQLRRAMATEDTVEEIVWVKLVQRRPPIAILLPSFREWPWKSS